jgi:glycosyl transferase family 1
MWRHWRIWKPISDKFRKKIYTLHPKDSVKGRVLFGYFPETLFITDDDPSLDKHNNKLASRTIGLLFSELGYIVDAVALDDMAFTPRRDYDVVFTVADILTRWKPYLSDTTFKIVHLAGADTFYSNIANLKRVSDVMIRQQKPYTARRFRQNPENHRYAIQLANACSLIGNEHTLATFPETLHPKLHLVTVSTSKLGSNIKSEDEYVPPQREFVWFFGTGPIHKGLDLVLEVFAQNPHLTLNVFGGAGRDAMFMSMYGDELLNLPNIHYQGRVEPNSETFGTVIRRSIAFIAPSCSESISTAAATCMKSGLYPIISYDTGITIPNDCGIYLKTCSIPEIETAVKRVHTMEKAELVKRIRATQSFALKTFSREQFYDDMKAFLTKVLPN